MYNHNPSTRGRKLRRKMRYHNRASDIPDCSSIRDTEDYLGIDDGSPRVVENERREAPRPLYICAAKSASEFNETDVDPSSPKTNSPRYMTQRSYSRSRTSSYGSYRSSEPSPLTQLISKILEQAGVLIAELFIKTCEFLSRGNYNQTHLTIAGVLLLCYFFAFYVEFSVASLLEIICDWTWPAMHIMLRSVEHFFGAIGRLFASVDDMGHSIYCDMAELWCRQFHLMCARRCTFTAFALERLRT